MKTSLWIVIALVSGIVGFLTGYSVSSFSGATRVAGAPAPAAHAAPHEVAPPAVAKAADPPAEAGTATAAGKAQTTAAGY